MSDDIRWIDDIRCRRCVADVSTFKASGSDFERSILGEVNALPIKNSLCIWVLDIQCVWSQKEGANRLVCCVCMCLCPSFTWVALHLKCCIGWINTAVSHQCDSFERNSHPKFVTIGQQGAVERTLQCKNLLGNLFSTRPKLYACQFGVSPSMPCRMIQIMLDHVQVTRLWRSNVVCLRLRLWYPASDKSFLRQDPHFYWARFFLNP